MWQVWKIEIKKHLDDLGVDVRKILCYTGKGNQVKIK
jgi:hypothetical protein